MIAKKTSVKPVKTTKLSRMSRIPKTKMLPAKNPVSIKD